ncbi:MAG TPA: YfiR family protein [Verrucomicrobiae bacterium]|nr:YfiR family protein [Verrucomicrobiae bacterium]
MTPMIARGRSLPAAFCLLLAATSPAVSSPAEIAPSREISLEYQVKAAFILNFVRFVEWPPPADGAPGRPLEILVLGNSPIDEPLQETLRGQTVMGRPLTVTRIEGNDRVDGCHILFIGRSESPRLDEILKRLQGRCILTVGEAEGFAEAGGVINFTAEQNKVRFEINPDAAQRAGLRISSKLLSLARIVKDGAQPGGD